MGGGRLDDRPASGIDVVGGEEPLANQRGHEESHIGMEIGHCAPMPRVRTIGCGHGLGIDGSPVGSSGTPRLRRGKLHVHELVEMPRNARAQKGVDPRQDAGVIDEETSSESSAPPVVLELQGEIVPSPLDLDEDPTEWILAERLCPRVRVLPARWKRWSAFPNEVAE